MQETENKKTETSIICSSDWLVHTLIDGRIGTVYVPNAYFEGGDVLI